MSTLIDGQASDHLPANDRGLLFGESVFETIAFHDGRAPLWVRHIERLGKGAATLGLAPPEADLLEQECRCLLSELVGQAVIRITLTAGSGGHGYWPAERPTSRRILQRRDWPMHLEQQRLDGVSVIISTHALGGAGPLTGLKHGNRLLQTLAARECLQRGAEEALLLDQQGQLGEAISSNLLLVSGSRIMTPARPDVAGVGLAWLSDRLGDALEIGSVGMDRLATLSEVLVINSVAGIRPVVAVEGQPFPRGPVGRRLQSIWHEELFPCA
ncbi:MAG: aminotransferase class IV [Wenzhouxiangella sp.]|jgi:4-amino-4-deoxychorismate lyase|nr:aminotransferase class IV [Wenzhouxiangella sp.]